MRNALSRRVARDGETNGSAHALIEKTGESCRVCLDMGLFELVPLDYSSVSLTDR